MTTRYVLEIINFRSGAKAVKPEGLLGTCGWSPKAWQIACVLPDETAVEAFLANNDNWSRDELIEPTEN